MKRIFLKMRWAIVALVMISAVILGSVELINESVATASAADISGNCVLYVQSQTGLSDGPATAAGYTEKVMNSKGYRKVNPQAGAILVWDAWQKGAYGAGHMAIITGANYNNKTKQWIITVRHANWGGYGIRSTTFTWGDLYGVNAYIRR
jgi:hypothetical protein